MSIVLIFLGIIFLVFGWVIPATHPIPLVFRVIGGVVLIIGLLLLLMDFVDIHVSNSYHNVGCKIKCLDAE